MFRKQLVLACFAALIAHFAAATTFPSMTKAQFDAKCATVAAAKPPAEDMKGFEKWSSDVCESSELYYGSTQHPQPNYKDARTCAFWESSNGPTPSGWMKGYDVLSMLYANGYGVKRNLPVAMQFVCNMHSTIREEDYRALAHLVMLDKTGSTTVYDHCDEIDSGLGYGTCGTQMAISGEISSNRRLAVLTKSWSTPEKQALKSLLAVKDKWVSARSDNEVARDGSSDAFSARSGRAARVVQDDFIRRLEDLDAGRPQRFTEADLPLIDQQLGKAVRDLGGNPTFAGASVHMTKQDIATSQAAWLAYRDAFIKFVKLKYPYVNSDAFAAGLDDARTTELNLLNLGMAWPK